MAAEATGLPLTKVIQHAVAYLMIMQGVTEGGGDHHLKLAITRLVMALAQEGGRGPACYWVQHG